jgi:hypothetical protein
VERTLQRDSKFLIASPDCSFEELASQQGVAPIFDFESLIGHPTRDDESAEEFSLQLRAWRCEASPAQ